MRLSERLAKDFPFMRWKRNEHEDEPYRAVFCGVGEGWYQLIYDMCVEITALYAVSELDANELFKPKQIKEKYGLLRFYYNTNIHAYELNREVHKIVVKYVDISEVTCESCGQPGKLDTSDYWHKVRCDICKEKDYQRRQQPVDRAKILRQVNSSVYNKINKDCSSLAAEEADS